jgi:myo-inositol-1(or 4)-monophosphatase
VTRSADPVDLCELAHTVAADAGRFLLDRMGAVADTTKSSPTDYVTDVDRSTEKLIVDALRSERPHDSFEGEEGTRVEGADGTDREGVRWIVDPIDGTTNFVYGHPGFTVSIAAEIDGTTVAGVVFDPVHDQLFEASIGSGARCNGAPISPRPTTELSRALVATGFSYSSSRRAEQTRELGMILPRIGDIRRMGSAAADLCSVALGRVDAYWETDLNEWDIAAGSLIAAESGAVVRAQRSGDDDLTLAAAPGIADGLIALVEEALGR